MTKKELIEEVMYVTDMSKGDLEKAVSAIFEEIEDRLRKKEKVHIKGFGTFEVRKIKQRKCSNPKTKEEMVIEEHYSPKFRPAKQLKVRVSE